MAGVWCLFLLSACAGGPKQETLVVLLPEPDGTTGQVLVSTPAGSRELSAAGEATTVSGAGTPPSEPFRLESEEIDKVFGRALEAQPERPAVFLLYFKPGSDELTEDSLTLLPKILEAIDLRRSVDTSIVGHSDTVGSDDYNYDLSRKRALAVRGLLVSRGAREEVLQVNSHGEKNLLVPTPDDTEEPRNRRVEVTVR
jgi:outer membrane protein OmpA-like peptidoglycan-associated protein